MKERPIIFNAEMVRAVLEGRKTQTRRIIVPSMRTADSQFELHQQPDGSWRPMHTFNEGSFDSKGCERPINCPFGAVGDRLWVRETWQAIHDSSDEHGNVDERTWMPSIIKESDSYWHPIYAASWGNEDRETRDFPWRPSLHMPRWASRITLEITGVRVERLHSITLGDICKEFGCGLYDFRPATYGFQVWEELWQSIYGEESWQANPWVWVIEFKRVEGE
ncbi:hypothetical protein [Pantoea sp. GM01]|uniref:hypothetical protein n=1 Tax=Pantoea sp. GM01 TaxID=1144320 RepID=UPI000270FFE8|nr:hypothetical protein [Pantoea sp. GM01]EJL90253.1 hypothetical protein PMI17_01773 [Pantoea sp. GM01]